MFRLKHLMVAVCIVENGGFLKSKGTCLANNAQASPTTQVSDQSAGLPKTQAP
jgi:hypothetical protein